MYIKSTEENITKAFIKTNNKFSNNLIIEKLERKNQSSFLFRMKTLSYNKPGYRISHNGRRIPYACWHAYGTFLDNLSLIDPTSQYKHRKGKLKLVLDHDWEDWNIGSQLKPLQFSNACNC